MRATARNAVRGFTLGVDGCGLRDGAPGAGSAEGTGGSGAGGKQKPRVALEVVKRTLSIRRRQAFEESHTLESMMHTITLAQPEIRAAIEEAYVD